MRENCTGKPFPALNRKTAATFDRIPLREYYIADVIESMPAPEEFDSILTPVNEGRRIRLGSPSVKGKEKRWELKARNRNKNCDGMRKWGSGVVEMSTIIRKGSREK